MELVTVINGNKLTDYSRENKSILRLHLCDSQASVTMTRLLLTTVFYPREVSLNIPAFVKEELQSLF